jgi:hypothetical protein
LCKAVIPLREGGSKSGDGLRIGLYDGLEVGEDELTAKGATGNEDGNDEGLIVG